MQITRRGLIGASGGLMLAGALPGMAWATTGGDKRLVFIIQRGAADGLALVSPTGDPGYARLRGALAEQEGGTKLDGMFTLHPSFTGLSGMFASGHAQVHHAVASRYRERSHFDGQNVLESGGAAPYARRDGWLNRLLTQLPPAERNGMAIAAAVPLALRGTIQAASYTPSRLPDADEDLLMRLSNLYDGDAQLGPLWASALGTRDMAADIGGNDGRNGAQLGELAASLMRGPQGARVMMLETGGWDTHSQQVRRLAAEARGLDALIDALRTGLAEDWGGTLVIVATEFGRTAAANGTAGTDHGTASALFLVGGAKQSGAPVVADWPGLGTGQLFENRDLKPTARIEDVISNAVATHFALDHGRLRTALYPDIA